MFTCVKQAQEQGWRRDVHTRESSTRTRMVNGCSDARDKHKNKDG